MTFGTNVGGVPAQVEGGVDWNTSSSQDSDGSTTVDATHSTAGDFAVTLPPGSEPLPGSDDIVIEFDDQVDDVRAPPAGLQTAGARRHR